MAGIDGFTKLMLHLNGADTSTTITDDSASEHLVTAEDNAQIDTAQSVFGGASGLLDGTGDYFSLANSEDFNFGTDSFTIDCRKRFNDKSGVQNILAYSTAGGAVQFFWDGSNFNIFSGSTFITTTGLTINNDVWYHLAYVRNGNNWQIYVNGVSYANVTDSRSLGTPNHANGIFIGAEVTAISQFTNGWFDEYRISKGVARWITGFTPPSEAYFEEITITPNILSISSSILSPTITIDTVVVPNVLNITSELITPAAIGDVLVITPNILSISSSIESPSVTSDVSITPNILTIVSSIETPLFPVQGSLIGKIISVNPLIAVTDTDPVQIIKIDTADPENLVYTSVTIPNISNSLDVSVNSANDYVYVAGDSGKVVKVEIADLTNQTTFDLSDTDNILTVEHNTNFGITYAGTDNDTGELYTIDERTTFSIDSDFTCLAPIEFKMDSDFNIVSAFKMDSDFTALSYQTFKMASAFNCFDYQPASPISSVDDVIPANLEDYQVFIDSVELEDTDLILNSISITHSVGEESTASFQLSRKHDQLDTTLEGVSSQITNQNTVEIKCKGITVFPFKGVGTGRVSDLDCQYQNNTEFVIVNATSEEATNQFNKITMSLPSVSSRLSLYDILIQNPKIINPYVDPDNEENPKKYKGIRVSLGTKIQQSLSKWTISDSSGSIADQIQEGTFNPIQNWTYFWSPTVTKIGDVDLGDPSAVTFFYIGTSLAPVSEDLWDLNIAKHYRQRIFEDIIIKLGDGSVSVSDLNDVVDNPSSVHSQLQNKTYLSGNTITNKFKKSQDSSELKLSGVTGNEQKDVYEIIEKALGYTVGSAPFKDVSVRNGQKITKPKLTDESDRLSSIKEAGYDFIDYAKEVADLEYEKLKNINGNILPDTSCTFNLTIDAFLYYDISLLTQMNVDNTTISGIYKNSNGFPVSVKTITITSNDRKVTLNADNAKSVKELETINSQFPDEDDDEYNEEEQRTLIALKSDMRTRTQVQ